MNQKIAITGMGIISSIGNNVEENYQSLLSKKKGISVIENLETNHKNSIKVGEIKQTNQELKSFLQLPENNNYTRTAILGEIAAKEAVKSANIQNINQYRTGIISATSVGGMDKTEENYYAYFENEAERKYIHGHHAGDSTKKIADSLGIKGFVSTISTACSSAANSIMLGAKLIQEGKLDRVIVGGTDCLSKFTINGFNTLMILSPEDCKPFDENRKGLNLGEAAAFLVLESDKIVQTENKKPLAYLSGFANANDAHHQTASSENGEGATLSMQNALEIAQLKPADIDYINAHGTATLNNDNSESIALKRIFEENIPSFSSTKSFTGHTLAAAGAIEAVYSVLALQHQQVFPSLNFETPIKELGLIPETEVVSKKINHVLSNSFGFGGNCSTLIFSKS